MEIMRGIGASPGIVIGETFVLDHEHYRVSQHRLKDRSERGISLECERFARCLESATQEITELADRTKKELGEGSEVVVNLLNFHLAVFRSRDMTRRVEGRIGRGQTAEHAVQEFMRGYRERFSQIPHMARRIADLNDLERRLLRHLLGATREALKDLTRPMVLIARDLDPTQTAELPLDKILGFATDAGGLTSHTSILAASRNLPAVVGLQQITRRLNGGETVILDGRTGRVVIDPDPTVLERYRERQQNYLAFTQGLVSLRGYPAETEDGYHVRLLANIEFPADVEDAMRHGADGIGLYRTEFLYSERNPNPSEEDHVAAYTEALKLLGADGVRRTLVIRTLDLGADKFSPDAELMEKNPFLGLRSIRWCFANRDVFMTQLRAILRVSKLGEVKIMLPMISSLGELLEAKSMIADAKEEMREAGVDFNEEIEVGIMVEVPSAALVADVLAEHADFFSIGTNDLVQYTLAVDRVNERVASYYQPAQLSIFRLLHRIVEAARRRNRPVSLCGEISGDPKYTLVLLGLGLSDLSMAPASVPNIKKFVRSLRLREAGELTRKVFEFGEIESLDAFLEEQAAEIVPDFFR